MKKLYLKHNVNDIYIIICFISGEIVKTTIKLVDKNVNISNEYITSLVLKDYYKEYKEINKSDFKKLCSEKLKLVQNILF